MNEFEETYGPSYPFAKYQIGETITFPDSSKPGGTNSGRVLHVTPPQAGLSCSYIVTPETDIFPVEVFANEVIEQAQVFTESDGESANHSDSSDSAWWNPSGE